MFGFFFIDKYSSPAGVRLTLVTFQLLFTNYTKLRDCKTAKLRAASTKDNTITETNAEISRSARNSQLGCSNN